MNRREFLAGTLASLAAASLPILYGGCDRSIICSPKFDVDELTGHKAPKLSNKRILMQADEQLNGLINAAYQNRIMIRAQGAYVSYDNLKNAWNWRASTFKKQCDLYTQEIVERVLGLLALPGTSRLHFGTEVNLRIDAPPEGVVDAQALIASYGFHQVYTADKTRKGYPANKRLYSFAPLSVPMLEELLGLDLHKTRSDLSLNGAKFLSPSLMESYISTYVLGINPSLKPTSTPKT